MAKKKDSSVTFLNKFGYNVVKLPRVGIEPMDVVGKDETTQWLGPLRTVWKSSTAEPAAGAPKPAAQVNGQKTDKLEIGFGLRILANALSAFGATVPSLDFAYNRASSVTFSYGNVTSTAVAPFQAGDYLANGTLNTSNPVVEHYFRSPDAEAYLIVEVLKSDTLAVTASDEHGVGVDVDFPAIQKVIGAKVGVKTLGTGSSTIQYSGPQPVTFGFIANAIEFNGTKWAIHGLGKDETVAFGAPVGGVAAVAATATATATSGSLPEAVLLSLACMVRL